MSVTAVARRGVARYVAAGVFGAFDGLTLVIGVLLSLGGRPALVVPTTVGVAVAEGVGMAAGEWLSDSEDGFAESATIGVVSFGAAMLPALPYGLAPAGWAPWCAAVLVLMLAAGIAVVRSEQRGARRAVAETFGVLIVVVGAVWASSLLAPAGGAA